MKSIPTILAVALPLAFGATVAQAQIFVPTAPPPLQRETVPPRPHAGVTWQPGFWRWDGRQYFWQPGSYVAPPRRLARWVPGHWASRRGGYVWIEGHWR